MKLWKHICFPFPFQLSSKCDNKLFRIKFNVPKAGKYPFLEALSYPIRCISRNRNARTSSIIIWKRPSGILSVNGSQSSRANFGLSDLPRSTVREAKPSPLSKRVRLGNYTFEQPDDECNSHVQTATQVNKTAFVKIISILSESFWIAILIFILMYWLVNCRAV